MRKRKVDTIRYCGQWRITLWSNDESRDEEKDDGSTWKICKIPRIELTKKCGDWIQWDICDKYVCPKCSGDEVAPKCYDKRYISEMMIFLYYLHWIINIKIKSHSILHYLQSADLSKKSFNWLCHRNIWLCQYWLFSVNGQLSFLSIISIDLKVWGYPALLISWFINFKVSRVLNYAMKSPIFTESLLISIHLVKIFQFFLCAFTWNRPSTT